MLQMLQSHPQPRRKNMRLDGRASPMKLASFTVMQRSVKIRVVNNAPLIQPRRGRTSVRSPVWSVHDQIHIAVHPFAGPHEARIM